MTDSIDVLLAQHDSAVATIAGPTGQPAARVDGIRRMVMLSGFTEFADELTVSFLRRGANAVDVVGELQAVHTAIQ